MLLSNKRIVAAAIAVILANLILWIYAAHTAHSVVDTFNSDDNYVYVICDVYDVVSNGQTVEIDIVLPNGQLLTRQMSIDSDLPEGFREVVIQTSNLDDYSTYKIVGMR